MTKCWYKHMYEMIYQSLTVWQFFWHNHRTYFIMGYFIRKLLTINKAKSLGTEEFFFSIFSNGYQQEKKITPLVERLFFFDALWWICHDWTSEYITEHQNISHVVYQWSNMYLYGTVIHWYSLIKLQTKLSVFTNTIISKSWVTMGSTVIDQFQ